jgi:signal transduction histidine kinase/DNA-binding LacI/PurR family transcriptional regulator/AraC-like DNA-binding protein/DNA-binding response OmpR family regulator
MEDRSLNAREMDPSTQPIAERKRPDQRVTIGFLTAYIHVDVSRRLWRGVVDAAARHNINVVCFPGGGPYPQTEFEAQRSVIYDLVNPAGLDGLISWSSTITGSLDPADIRAFLRRYRPLPTVCLTQPVPGFPTVSVDTYQGMHAAVVHLIQVHGCRRLAFIRGPADHYYAQERYRAYLDGLAAYDIPFDAELVTPCLDWRLESGTDAIRLLLDEAGLRPGIDMQAIAAVGDMPALGALRALQARGIQVPRDLAIVGFNDTREGRFATPPLTSVAMPFNEQGARAIDTVLALCRGEEVPALVTLQSRLAVRQSCGCPSRAVLHAAEPVEAHHAETTATYAQLRESILDEMAQATNVSGINAIQIGQILDTFHGDLSGRPSGRFLEALEAMLEQVANRDEDVAAWQDGISALRRGVLPSLDSRSRQRAEALLGQARVLIGEIAQRVQAYRQLQADRHLAILRDIGQALITAFDIGTLTDALAEHLPRLGIASGYLAIYENPALPTEAVRLILAYTEHGQLSLEPGGRRYPSRELVPADLLPQQRRFSMVIEPLFFREEQIGYVLFEIGPRDPSVYEVLGGYISSALKGAQLISEVHQARLNAEKADRIKTRLLANVSHELRTPLHIILERTRAALDESGPYGSVLPQDLLSDIKHIQHSAEHQLRLINDLLDLSRAEIDELDLYLEPLDPRPLLEATFHSMASSAALRTVRWELHLCEHLPWIHADAVRLRQILLNLLSNAQKFTESGHVALGAAGMLGQLHIWIEDTGIGIPSDQQERIFEPFVTAERSRMGQSGIGLGLAITRRLVALHRGTLTVEARPSGGSMFHIYLPLPNLSQPPAAAPAHAQQVLLVISTSADLADEIITFSRRQGLTIYRLQAGNDLESALASVQPAALAWDLFGATPRDWLIVRRLRQRANWSQLPFIVYGRAEEATLGVGLTSFVAKPSSAQTLIDTLSAACPAHATGSILIVDDDPSVRELHRDIVAQALPGYPIRTAGDGPQALILMAEEVPSLVLLDLVMPRMEGTDVLDQMRADSRLRQVPVIVLSSKLLTLDDIKRIEQHAHVTLQSKGILSEEETIALLQRVLSDGDTLPPQTSALVKRAVAYLHQNYARQISRWELAQEVGASEDYLSRVFNRDLGLSPWEYLNRYRIYQAKDLLRRTNDSISSIAQQVGFHDQKYFSRVFRNLAGSGPREFRERSEPA